MSSSQNLLKLFYKYSSDTILYLKDGKLKGYITRQDVTESLSNISDINTDLVSFVHEINDMDKILNFLEESKIIEGNKKRIPVINKKFEFIGLWERVDVIKSWEDIPTIAKWNMGTSTDKETYPAPPQENISGNGGLGQKLALLAIETLPIGMLAISILGEEILCNEDWLNLKRKYPKELTTKNIIYKAKNAMAEEAFKKDETFSNMTFCLDSILKDQNIKMRLIRNKNKTIGYLFWKPESGPDPLQRSSSTGYSYKGRGLKDILTHEEKSVLKWAIENAGGHIGKAAKMIGVSKQTFGYKYKKYF